MKAMSLGSLGKGKAYHYAFWLFEAVNTSDFICDLHANPHAISLSDFVSAVASTMRT
jgi:hypothetical protein